LSQGSNQTTLNSSTLSSSTLSSSTLAPTKEQFWFLQICRAALGLLFVCFLVQVVELGISSLTVYLGLICGSYFAGRFLWKHNSFSSVSLKHAIYAVVIYLSLFLLNHLVLKLGASFSSADFLIPKLSDDLLLISVFYFIGFVSTWFFWKSRSALTFEALGVSIFFVSLLAAHRNYQVDAPRQISSLAWKLDLLQKFRVEPQHIFLSLGLLLAVGLVFYFSAADKRSLFGERKLNVHRGRSSKITASTLSLFGISAFLAFAWSVNKHYSADLSRVSNGVGSTKESKEGQSNLGFHEAVAGTKQPAALLRLEGDYKNNPWAPMIYLREGGLSKYAGKEIVKAGSGYDSDVPHTAVGESFLSHITEPGQHREKVVQSIYLLSEHGAPFAIDFPRRIAPIKNPYPEKFRAAYQALSYAPTEALKTLIGEPIGDSSWDEATWKHYLRAPGSNSKDIFSNDPSKLIQALESKGPVLDSFDEDLRYLAKALSIAGDTKGPINKAMKIINYLSAESLYTRKPGHQVTKHGDPVAPYLFSKEMRGYCVHFAHAASYMLRLLDIPARIGTGYLSDTTYAKDGHILLQLGDRHAWPEIFIQDRGWVVIDITPAQAENEDALTPDAKLLEDLMNKLNPVEELLDPIAEEIEDDQTPPFIQKLFALKYLGNILSLLLLLFIIAKLWLKYSYLLTKNPVTRTKRAYGAFASTMIDRGLPRFDGETREEYSRRLLKHFGVNSNEITKFLEIITYSSKGSAPSKDDVSQSLREVINSHNKKFSKLKQIASFFNPLSLSRFNAW